MLLSMISGAMNFYAYDQAFNSIDGTSSADDIKATAVYAAVEEEMLEEMVHHTMANWTLYMHAEDWVKAQYKMVDGESMKEGKKGNKDKMAKLAVKSSHQYFEKFTAATGKQVAYMAI